MNWNYRTITEEEIDKFKEQLKKSYQKKCLLRLTKIGSTNLNWIICENRDYEKMLWDKKGEQIGLTISDEI